MVRESKNLPDALLDPRNTRTEEKKEGRSCATCFYCIEARSPFNPLDWLKVCKFGPPNMAILQNQMLTLDTVVTDQGWCFQWKRDPLATVKTDA